MTFFLSSHINRSHQILIFSVLAL